MSETDPGLQPIFKMGLAVTIINGSPIYAKSLVLARRLPDLSYITHIIVICKISVISNNSPQPNISLLLYQVRFAPIIP